MTGHVYFLKTEDTPKHSTAMYNRTRNRYSQLAITI